MDGEPGAGVQLLMTDVALEVFGFLMLDENLFIIEISVTVPTPRLHLLFLLPAHDFSVVSSLPAKNKNTSQIWRQLSNIP